MKKYAVGHMSFKDNELKIRIVEAEGWKEAFVKSFNILGMDTIRLSDDLEEAKIEAYNRGLGMFEVKEIE